MSFFTKDVELLANAEHALWSFRSTEWKKNQKECCGKLRFYPYFAGVQPLSTLILFLGPKSIIKAARTGTGGFWRNSSKT